MNSEMHFSAVIERVWRCNWRASWSQLRDALGGHDQSSLEIHWDAVIERVWRCPLRPRSSKFGDGIGDQD